MVLIPPAGPSPGASASGRESTPRGPTVTPAAVFTLHGAASAAAADIVARFGAGATDEVRTIVGFYQSAQIVAARAARDVLSFALRLGLSLPRAGRAPDVVDGGERRRAAPNSSP